MVMGMGGMKSGHECINPMCMGRKWVAGWQVGPV